MSNLSLIETARDFNRFYTNFLGLLNKAYLDTPFTLTDARILFEIGSHGGISAVALARDLQLDPAYLSRILKRFRAEGLIETSPDPADLRSQVIIITDQGRETFEELGRRSNAQIAARFDRLATGEPEAAVSAMHTIRALLDPAAKPALSHHPRPPRRRYRLDRSEPGPLLRRRVWLGSALRGAGRRGRRKIPRQFRSGQRILLDRRTRRHQCRFGPRHQWRRRHRQASPALCRQISPRSRARKTAGRRMHPLLPAEGLPRTLALDQRHAGDRPRHLRQGGLSSCLRGET